MKVGIIGAGAAGCFCAIQLKRSKPSAEVTVLEANTKPLAKVAVTGGGRCNFTNSFEGISSVGEAYPRGEMLMKRALKVFSNNDTCDWFEREGVPYVIQEDQCIFPVSQDAMQIVSTLTSLMKRHGVKLVCSSRVRRVTAEDGGFTVFVNGNDTPMHFDRLVITTGGAPKPTDLEMLDGLDLDMESPVPSLFTFNVTDKALRELMGTVVEDAALSIPGTQFRSHGPLLITHWGLSGPAALKLSAYAARYLSEKSYTSPVTVNWMHGYNMDEIRDMLFSFASEHGQKLVTNIYPKELNSHLWKYIVTKALGKDDLRWNALGKKGINRLVETLSNDSHTMNGKSRFREEFVTCGGISLSEISLKTLESKKHPGLYFAGEVLDVDAITGGFNLQAAWSMGYIVAESISCDVSSSF